MHTRGGSTKEGYRGWVFACDAPKPSEPYPACGWGFGGSSLTTVRVGNTVVDLLACSAKKVPNSAGAAVCEAGVLADASVSEVAGEVRVELGAREAVDGLLLDGVPMLAEAQPARGHLVLAAGLPVGDDDLPADPLPPQRGDVGAPVAVMIAGAGTSGAKPGTVEHKHNTVRLARLLQVDHALGVVERTSSSASVWARSQLVENSNSSGNRSGDGSPSCSSTASVSADHSKVELTTEHLPTLILRRLDSLTPLRVGDCTESPRLVNRRETLKQ
ncbi:hypothetical protein [Halovenus salina]|uniref:Uncharacterized protein n=1 Tax=Halovenus salina TaxID=1510225 RepID=A0ABD5VV93_9EURY